MGHVWDHYETPIEFWWNINVISMEHERNTYSNIMENLWNLIPCWDPPSLPVNPQFDGKRSVVFSFQPSRAAGACGGPQSPYWLSSVVVLHGLHSCILILLAEQRRASRSCTSRHPQVRTWTAGAVRLETDVRSLSPWSAGYCFDLSTLSLVCVAKCATEGGIFEAGISDGSGGLSGAF